jgi:hypothetical protein
MRHFVFLFCCCCAVIFFSCASLDEISGQKEKITVPQDFAGMVHAGRTASDTEYEFLDALGVSWILTTFYWNAIEPERGVWNFSGSDKYVEAAKSRGKKILIVLAYDASWLNPKGKTRRYIEPKDIPRYVEFVERVVMRYKGQVDAWQIWNEPNWIFWKGARKDYFALAEAGAKKIREIDPDAQLLTGGILRAPNSFVNALFDSGAMSYGSQASVHPYDLNPEGSARVYDSFCAALAKNGYTDDVWVTEVGYPTGGLYPTRVSEKKLGPLVTRTLTLLAARGARAVFWYQLFDPPKEERNSFNSEDFFGLAFPDYTMKRSAWKFAVCAKNIAGKIYDPAYPMRAGIKKSIRAIYFEGEDGSHTLIVWKNTGKSRLRLSQSARVINSLTLEETSIDAGETVIVTTIPLVITWTEAT